MNKKSKMLCLIFALLATALVFLACGSGAIKEEDDYIVEITEKTDNVTFALGNGKFPGYGSSSEEPQSSSSDDDLSSSSSETAISSSGISSSSIVQSSSSVVANKVCTEPDFKASDVLEYAGSCVSVGLFSKDDTNCYCPEGSNMFQYNSTGILSCCSGGCELLSDITLCGKASIPRE